MDSATKMTLLQFEMVEEDSSMKLGSDSIITANACPPGSEQRKYFALSDVQLDSPPLTVSVFTFCSQKMVGFEWM